MTSTRSIFPVMDTVILLVLNHGVDPVRCFRGPLHFLGSPPMNLLDATLDGDRLNWPASECRCRSGSTGSEARSSSGSVRRIGFAEDGIPATANWPNCSVTHDHRPQGRREAPEGAADAEPPLRRRRDGTIGRRLAPRALLTRPAPVSISPAAGSHATAP